MYIREDILIGKDGLHMGWSGDALEIYTCEHAVAIKPVEAARVVALDWVGAISDILAAQELLGNGTLEVTGFGGKSDADGGEVSC